MKYIIISIIFCMNALNRAITITTKETDFQTEYETKTELMSCLKEIYFTFRARNRRPET